MRGCGVGYGVKTTLSFSLSLSWEVWRWWMQSGDPYQMNVKVSLFKQQPLKWVYRISVKYYAFPCLLLILHLLLLLEPLLLPLPHLFFSGISIYGFKPLKPPFKCLVGILKMINSFVLGPQWIKK